MKLRQFIILTTCARLLDAIAIFVHNFLPSEKLMFEPEIHGLWRSSGEYATYRSYAVDVRKEMTKPSTVPSTVNIWFEIANDVEVSLDTEATTIPMTESVICSRATKGMNVLHPMSVKNSTSGHMSFMTVA